MLLFGYYKEFTFALSEKMSIILKIKFIQSPYLSHSKLTLNDHEIKHLLKLQV